MVGYIVVLSIILLMYILSKVKPSGEYHKVTAFVLFLFASFRGNGNGDYFRYIEILNENHIRSLMDVLNKSDYPFEIGFRFIDYLHYQLNLHPQVVIGFMSLISLSAMYYLIKKHTKNPALTYLFFFPTFLYLDMHHSRSGVALSFGLLFVSFFLDKKYLYSFVSLVVACSFHQSAFIYLLLLPILNENVNKAINEINIKIILNIILFLIVFSIVFNPLEIISEVLKILNLGSLQIKFSSYIANERWSYYFSLLDPRFILVLGTYIIGNLFIKVNDKYFSYFNNILLLGIVTSVLFHHSTIMVTRLSVYFYSILILYIPLLLTGDKINSLKLIDKFEIHIFELVYVFVFTVYSAALITQQVPYYLFF